MILFFDIYYIGNFHVKWILGQVLIKLLKSLTKLKVTVCKGRLFYTKQPFILLTIQNYKKRKRIICLKIWPQTPETKLDCQWSSYIKDKEITSHCYENKIWKSAAQIVSMSLEKEFFKYCRSLYDFSDTVFVSPLPTWNLYRQFFHFRSV